MTSDELYDLVQEAVSQNSYNYLDWFKEISTFLQQNQHGGQRIAGFQFLLTYLQKNKQPSRNKEIASICGKFYSDEAILKYFFQTRDEAEQSIISQLTWEGVVTYDEAKAFYNCGDLVELDSSYTGFQLKPEFKQWKPYIDWYKGYQHLPNPKTNGKEFIRNKRITFSFPLFMRVAYAQILPKPIGYDLKPIQISKNWIVCQMEDAIFEEFPNILLLYQQEIIKITQTGDLNISSIKATQKKLKTKVFPGNNNYLRILMIASFIYDQQKLSSLKNTLEMIRFIFREQRKTYMMMDVLLFNFGGTRTIDNHYLNPTALKNAMDLIKQLPEDGWISWENLQIYANTHYFDLELVSDNKVNELHPIYNLDILEAYRTAAVKVKLKFIREQLVTSMIQVAASYGLVELAFNDKQLEELKENPRATDIPTFVACRLTALGASVLRDKPGYQIPDSAKPTSFKLDPEALNIYVTGNMDMAIGLFKDWTRQLGDNTLVLDKDKIVANSKSKENLLYNIQQFIKTLGHEPPDFWKGALMEMVYRASALQPLNSAWVFKLSPYDKQLHRLMAQDQMLKKLTLKAEDYTVIVAHLHVEQFIKRMAQIGYVTDETHEFIPKDIQFLKEMPAQEKCIKDFNRFVLNIHR